MDPRIPTPESRVLDRCHDPGFGHFCTSYWPWVLQIDSTKLDKKKDRAKDDLRVERPSTGSQKPERLMTLYWRTNGLRDPAQDRVGHATAWTSSRLSHRVLSSKKDTTLRGGWRR
jgi:hypothetical protein